MTDNKVQGLLSHLGVALREMRKRAGLKQGELAKLSGVSQSRISKLERGEEKPGIEKAMALAYAAGSSLAELETEMSRLAGEGHPLVVLLESIEQRQDEIDQRQKKSDEMLSEIHGLLIQEGD